MGEGVNGSSPHRTVSNHPLTQFWLIYNIVRVSFETDVKELRSHQWIWHCCVRNNDLLHSVAENGSIFV